MISYRVAAADARLAAPRLGIMAGDPPQTQKGRTTIATVVRPFFLAYLNAGFLLLALYAVELRIGSAK